MPSLALDSGAILINLFLLQPQPASPTSSAVKSAAMPRRGSSKRCEKRVSGSVSMQGTGACFRFCSGVVRLPAVPEAIRGGGGHAAGLCSSRVRRAGPRSANPGLQPQTWGDRQPQAFRKGDTPFVVQHPDAQKAQRWLCSISLKIACCTAKHCKEQHAAAYYLLPASVWSS